MVLYSCTLLLCGLAIWFVPVKCQATAPVGGTYRVTTIEDPPFMTRQANSTTEFSGFLVDVLAHIGERLNATFIISHVADARYGTKVAAGYWTGMIGEVTSGQADLAASLLTMTAERARAVDFSQPFLTTGIRIVISKSAGSVVKPDVFRTLFTPLRAEVWVTMLVLCAVVVGLMCFIARFSPWERLELGGAILNLKDTGVTLPNSISMALGAMTWHGDRNVTPRSVSGRTLLCAWWIFASFSLLIYLGNLTAFILNKPTSVRALPFLSFDDMARQTEIEYGSFRSGSTLRYFQNSEVAVEQRVWQGMKDRTERFPTNMAEGLARVRTGKFALIMEELSATVQVNSQPCDLMMVGESRDERSYAFACHQGSGLCRQLDTAILGMIESGYMHHLRNKWLYSQCAKPGTDQYTALGSATFEKSAKGQKEEKAVSMETFAVPVALATIGLVLSMVALVGEIFWARRYGEPIYENEDQHRFAMSEVK